MNFDEYCDFVLEMHSEDFDLDFSVEMTDKATQGIFSMLWADWMQNEIPRTSKYYVSLSQQDISEISPSYTDFMKGPEKTQLEDLVYSAIAKFEEANDNTDIKDLYQYALKMDGQDPENVDDASTPEMFGYYILMKMMGHGVSWEDDHVKPGFNYPHFELSYLQFPDSFKSKTEMTPEELGISEDEEDSDEPDEWEYEGEEWKGDDFDPDSGDKWKQ